MARRNVHASTSDLVVVHFPASEETLALLNGIVVGRVDPSTAMASLEALPDPTGPR